MIEETSLSLDGTADAVRQGLSKVMQSPPLFSLPQKAREAAELVLAEVLNNIVEHAYGGSGGPVRLHLRRERDGDVFCHVSDDGVPLAAGMLPLGLLPKPEELSEGGYGWFLIRALARDLSYIRQRESNTLSFRLAPDRPCH